MVWRLFLVGVDVTSDVEIVFVGVKVMSGSEFVFFVGVDVLSGYFLVGIDEMSGVEVVFGGR